MSLAGLSPAVNAAVRRIKIGIVVVVVGILAAWKVVDICTWIFHTIFTN